jgi:hypothetical protein
MKQQKIQSDITDMIFGVGIGLCFSLVHWNVGLILMAIALVGVIIKSDKKR